ncbi:MAG: hypothetical protein JWM27_236 [Gemmatimonadetes bacterium]|nr:hypothetical protein [Gemmatimonadota bacterium]
MHPSRPVRLPLARLDRRGVALPLALLGLIAVSLLVTTMLLTSSTEASVSAANAGAVQSLYDAEGGLQVYVDSMTDRAMVAGDSGDYTLPNSTRKARITVSRLAAVPFSTAGVLDSTRNTFAIMSRPLRGTRVSGRSVVAMVRQVVYVPNQLNAKINSSVTIGGDLHVNGNAFTINGRSTECANSGDQGVQAVTGSSGSTVTVNNNNMYQNFLGVDSANRTTQGTTAITNSHMTKAELAAYTLGGSLSSIIASLPDSVKYGPLYGSQVWPGAMPAGDSVAVIDANHGTVSIGSGSGIIIVVNGNISMTGNATFNGIIVVEGTFSLRGTPTVNGALISLDTDNESEIILDDSDIGAGHVTVQYNKCATDAAIRAFRGVATPPAPRTTKTFAWSEIIR